MKKLKTNPLFVDNFAGGGGASLGIARALGRDVDIAINHDRESIAMHKANHPNTQHYVEDVFDIDPAEVCAGRRVLGAWFSPDCLKGDTLILTRFGFKPIADVYVDDEVLTHRGRWRRVVRTMKSQKRTVIVKGRGHWGMEMSPSHKVPLRSRTELASRRYRLEAPCEIPIGDGEGCYWSAPTQIPAAVAVVPLPSTACDTEEFWWFVGRWLADGSMDGNRVQWTIVEDKAQTMLENTEAYPLPVVDGNGDDAVWRRRTNGPVVIFSISSPSLQEWLREHFGEHAGSKRLPAWVYQLSQSARLSILDGMAAGDGCPTPAGGNCGDRQRLSTGSRFLAVGSRLLAESLGYPASLFCGPPRQSADAAGRAYCGNLPEYEVRWAVTEPKAKRHVIDGDKIWYPIYAGKILQGSAESTLYNLEVEEDHTYLADGIFVCNCTHFSKARGGKPVSKKIRGLAWIVLRWAATVRPEIIFMENVNEFETWGPLTRKRGRKNHPQPCAYRKYRTFHKWYKQLKDLGYEIDYRELRACDYGAPTIRKRMFLVARCDGKPILWPEPTHVSPAASNGKPSFKTAAECIDWTIDCPSIFMTKAEAKTYYEHTGVRVKRPLADNTLRRIARGVKRYVVEAERPFIVTCNHSGQEFRGQSVDEPMRTITAARDAHGLIMPVISRIGQTGGGGAYVYSVEAPLTTVTSKAEHLLVEAFLTQYNGEAPHQDTRGQHLARPLTAISTRDRHALVSSHLMKMRGTSKDGQPLDQPAATITGQGNHLAEVRAFLIKWYGTAIAQPLDEPAHTVTTKDRLGLIVTVGGDPYAIVDIGMRMLTPEELFECQGFDVRGFRGNTTGYDIWPFIDGKRLTKTKTVARCGNAVCPSVAEALVKVNIDATRRDRHKEEPRRLLPTLVEV